jgi:hypothetical protein
MNSIPKANHMPIRQPKLLDRVRNKLRLQHTSIRTEKAYLAWITDFIYFHKIRNPIDMGVPEIEAYLTFLPVEGPAAR